MYRLTIKNNETGVQWLEYGFSRFLMKRMYSLSNERYDIGCPTYEIIYIDKIGFTAKTFYKCLINEVKEI